MLTLAFIEIRAAMKRRLIGARLDDPVIPESARTVPEGRREAVDRGRPAQRRPHVPVVAPQGAGRHEDLS
jgi:hypothetical protein